MREIGSVDFGILFQKLTAFDEGRVKLRASHPDLAVYLLSARTELTETLALLRNDMEHNGWTLPMLQYRLEQGRPVFTEPTIAGISLSAFVGQVISRAIRFVEDLTA